MKNASHLAKPFRVLFLLTLLIPALPGLRAQGKATQVKGLVQSISGEPLPDVSVIIRNANTNFTSGSSTDSAGIFTFAVPAGGPFSFAFSSVGYQPQTLSGYHIKEGSTLSLVVKLQSTAGILDQVVVVGYGTVRRKDLTGTVSSIRPDEILKSPSGNVLEAAAGKLSGVDITRSSGLSGAGVNITVRGNRSINARNDPLYIVDGIQYPNIQDINPNDILSMDVLKDASTTAIYGSRGANGVIIITTKRGTAGRVRVTAGAYYGVSEVAGYPVPMNAAQYITFKRQAYRTGGTWNSVADDPKIFTSSQIAAINDNTSTYWAGNLLNRGSQQDYVIGVAGGNEKTKVYFSFDYYKEKGVLKNDFSNRYTLRLNIDQNLFTSLKVGLQSQLAYYDQNQRIDNVLSEANKGIPYYSPYNTDGTLAKFPGNAALPNPLLDDVEGAYVNKNNITRLLSSAYAEWKPATGLVIRTNLGIVNSSNRNGHFEDASTIVRLRSSGSLSSVTNTIETNVTWENIINYQRTVGDHSFNVTAITSFLSNQFENSSASGTGQLLPGQSFYALQNNPSNLAIASNYSKSNLQSGAFRLNYSFKEKYLLTLTGREDGASVLAPKNRWAFFPAAAVAWRIMDENFMKPVTLISDLKLRGSFGVAGNSAVKPYQTQNGLLLIPFSWNDQTALAYGLQPQVGNEDLNWELTTTKNIGIDFGVLKNRISGSVDVYDSKTTDLLYLQQLPTTTGGRSILNNVGKSRNSGIEVALSSTNIRTTNFTWTSAITYTRNRERIVYLPNGSDIANSLIVGYPVSSFYDYKKIGIWQTNDKNLASAYGYKPGDIRVEDISGPDGKPDGKITALHDRIVVGSAVPRYMVGFNNGLKYKNFDLNVFVNARIGQLFVSDYARKYEPDAIENGAVVDYWTPENPTNAYPQPDSRITKEGLPFYSTLGYKEGSFVKFRNITVGYTLPSSLAKKMHVTSFRWYATAKNYFTLSKVKEYDPEGNGSFNQPLTKLIVTGINVEF